MLLATYLSENDRQYAWAIPFRKEKRKQWEKKEEAGENMIKKKVFSTFLFIFDHLDHWHVERHFSYFLLASDKTEGELSSVLVKTIDYYRTLDMPENS